MGGSSSKNKQHKKAKKTVKLLTLGVQGSGKSTFIKQIKIIVGGFTTEEVILYKEVLLKNVMIGIQELTKQTEKLEYVIDSKNRKYARFFEKMIVFDTQWDEQIYKAAMNLWNDKAIQSTWKQGGRYPLQMTHIDYLMKNLDRFTQPEFKPTNDDILHARQRTTGTNIHNFVFDKCNWEIVDVGGQKPEREKWESVLGDDKLVGVIWFTALDEFNTASSEEIGKTKMQISLEVFEEVINCVKIKDRLVALILFLNKVDLLDKKLKNEQDVTDFKEMFPKIKAPIDLDSATKCVSAKFRSLVSGDRDLNVHVTNALDTEVMETIFKSVRETIFLTRVGNMVSL